MNIVVYMDYGKILLNKIRVTLSDFFIVKIQKKYML